VNVLAAKVHGIHYVTKPRRAKVFGDWQDVRQFVVLCDRLERSASMNVERPAVAHFEQAGCYAGGVRLPYCNLAGKLESAMLTRAGRLVFRTSA
jgi:hypothetical protein